MLNLNEFAKEVHAVAVEHGWWEGEENNDAETKLALIHAEWSEALEEYRANRPMVWFECMTTKAPCDADSERCSCWCDGECVADDRGSKPEGIAIELTDGVIRILDLMAHMDTPFEEEDYIELAPRTLPQLVTMLHYATAIAGGEFALYGMSDEAAGWLCSCITIVREWLKEQGEDLGELLRLKHEYNKTRSYRHGGKRC